MRRLCCNSARSANRQAHQDASQIQSLRHRILAARLHDTASRHASRWWRAGEVAEREHDTAVACGLAPGEGDGWPACRSARLHDLPRD